MVLNINFRVILSSTKGNTYVVILLLLLQEKKLYRRLIIILSRLPRELHLAPLVLNCNRADFNCLR